MRPVGGAGRAVPVGRGFPHRVRFFLSATALTTLLAGCASMQDTPRQEYTRTMGHTCNTGTMWMSRVESDGRYWVQGASNVISLTPYFDCMKEQFKLHPYQEWLKANRKLD